MPSVATPRLLERADDLIISVERDQLDVIAARPGAWGADSSHPSCGQRRFPGTARIGFPLYGRGSRRDPWGVNHIDAESAHIGACEQNVHVHVLEH